MTDKDFQSPVGRDTQQPDSLPPVDDALFLRARLGILKLICQELMRQIERDPHATTVATALLRLVDGQARIPVALMRRADFVALAEDAYALGDALLDGSRRLVLEDDANHEPH